MDLPRLRLAALVAGLAGLAAPARSATDTPPNIVFVLADDLGYGDLGAYGQRQIRTPSLDRLAAQGLRFTQHYAGNAVCAPSRSVLLTGLHPGHTPIRDNREVQPEGQWPLPAGAVTIASLLKARGYATGAFGKWGLGPPGSTGDPLRQGFDRFFGYNCQRQAHNHYPTYLYDDARRVGLDNPAFPAHQPLPAGADPLDPRSYARFSGRQYAPDLTWEKARAFVRENRERPFFLFVPTTVPHLALQVPEDSLAEYRGRFPETPYRGDRSYLPHPTPRAAYAAMVTRLDREVGRLLALLHELGLDERTIVVFTSDNGPTFDAGGADSAFFRSAGELRGLKASLYEGGVRVPAIVRFPGRVAAGRVSDRVTGFEDWLPTLLELVGRADPAKRDGISFAPTLLGREQPPRPFLYREFAGYGGQQSIRVGDWKGVRQQLQARAAAGAASPPLELYDLRSDPAESRDVSAAHPDVVARLESLMAAEHTPSAVFPLPTVDGPAPGAAAPPDAAAPGYEARATSATAQPLLGGGEAAWSPASVVSWGPQAYATSFRALWSSAGLFFRFDVTDPDPWHTLTRRDEKLWNEEVVELFLDVGSTRRSYAEIEVNPTNAVVDLWVEPARKSYDKDWDAVGLETRVVTRHDATGLPDGWIATGFLPWQALASKAPAGTALPPRTGDRWRFNVFRIERPAGPTAPEKGVLYLPWAPTGGPSFHVPEAFREIVFGASDAAGAAGRPAAPAEREACVDESRVTMGCSATVRACAADETAVRAAASDAFDEIDRLDRLLSHYRRDSALSQLNRTAADGPVVVDRELFELLELSLRFSRESDGAFDVTVGPLMKAWGFFRDEGRVPDAATLRSAWEAVGHRHVILDPLARTVRFDRRGVELDLGGIGKGYAVDRAVGRLRARGIRSALVNLGGSSVYGLGAPPNADAWVVGIRDPTRRDGVARSVTLRDRALSVAGGYERFFEKDGVVYTHVMDPRTGRPVRGVLSVAVLSDSATDGDALDDALFVQAGRAQRKGPTAARGGDDWRVFLAGRPSTQALVFLPAPGGWRVEAAGGMEVP